MGTGGAGRGTGLNQQPEPEDLVIATDRSVSLNHFVDRDFRFFGLDSLQHVISDNVMPWPFDIRHGAGSPARALYRLGWRSALNVDGVVDALCSNARHAMQKPPTSGATSP